MPSIEDCAYLAGIVDGEGHIAITLSGPRSKRGRGEWRTHEVIVTVANTHIPLLLWAQGIWGGTLVQRQQSGQRVKIGNLRWSARTADRVLKDIRPYMRVKGDQADIALAFAAELALRNGSRDLLTSDEWDRREELRVALRQLKRPDESFEVIPYPIERTQRTCVRCSTAFTDALGTSRKYCSDKCRNAVAWQRYKAKHFTPTD